MIFIKVHLGFKPVTATTFSTGLNQIKAFINQSEDKLYM